MYSISSLVAPSKLGCTVSNQVGPFLFVSSHVITVCRGLSKAILSPSQNGWLNNLAQSRRRQSFAGSKACVLADKYYNQAILECGQARNREGAILGEARLLARRIVD